MPKDVSSADGRILVLSTDRTRLSRNSPNQPNKKPAAEQE